MNGCRIVKSMTNTGLLVHYPVAAGQYVYIYIHLYNLYVYTQLTLHDAIFKLSGFQVLLPVAGVKAVKIRTIHHLPSDIKPRLPD